MSLRLLHPRELKQPTAASVPTRTRLLRPDEVRVAHLVSETARAFRFGPRISPGRAPYEFYPTPPEATRALLSVESFDGSIWEPACGEGHIAKVLEAAGHNVVSTDLVDHGFGESGRDFLAETRPLAQHIVTNPPYGRGLADAFVKHALKLTADTGGSVAMLMNITGLCHPMRHDFYVASPPAVIYALDECVCWPNGDPAQATTTIAKQRYCWMVWKPRNDSTTRFAWLSTRPFRDTRPLSSSTFRHFASGDS